MANYPKSIKRKSKKKSPLPLILVGAGLIVFSLAFFIFGSLSQGSAGNPQEDELRGTPAPELTLTDVQGHTVSLSDYRGHWVLVNNWATWCPPCRAEMPELNAYYQAHKDDGFVLIGISAGDTQAQVADFVSAFGIRFPMWVDPQQAALSAFRMNALPNSFVIDPEGYVRTSWTGAVTLTDLENRVTSLMEE
jgi:peroxiredoxin